jgi:hypothetical protein
MMGSAAGFPQIPSQVMLDFSGEGGVVTLEYIAFPS